MIAAPPRTAREVNHPDAERDQGGAPPVAVAGEDEIDAQAVANQRLGEVQGRALDPATRERVQQ